MVYPYILTFILIVYIVLQLVLILSNKTKAAFIISCIAIFLIVVYNITKAKNKFQSSRTLKVETDWISEAVAKNTQRQKNSDTLQLLQNTEKLNEALKALGRGRDKPDESDNLSFHKKMLRTARGQPRWIRSTEDQEDLIHVPTMDTSIRSSSDVENEFPMSFHKASQDVSLLAKEVGSEPIGPVSIDDEQRTNFITQQTNQKAKEIRDIFRRQGGIMQL